MQTRYEWWRDAFNELDTWEQVEIFNRFDDEQQFYELDDSFWNDIMSSAADAVSAALHGSVSLSDDYIHWDRCGNLESFSYYGVENEIADYIDEIYDDEDSWRGRIDIDEYEDYVYDRLCEEWNCDLDRERVIEWFCDGNYDFDRTEEYNYDRYERWLNEEYGESIVDDEVGNDNSYVAGDGDPMAKL